MAEVGDLSRRHFSIPLDGGEVVEYSGGTLRRPWLVIPEPELVLRMPVSRGHQLAHVIAVPPLASVNDLGVARTLEVAAAALGDVDAQGCAGRPRGVSAQRRVAALAALAVHLPVLGPTQRVALVDAAARWLEEETTGEMAWSLLLAVCRSEVAAGAVYAELLDVRGSDG
jgi:hypothetical protein